MPDETDKIIAEHMQVLPVYVKDAFKAAQPFEKIRAIAADFKLHIDQTETLEQEVLLVMLGLESPDTFIDETSKSFDLSEEDSRKLVDRISSELFMPIRDAMQRYAEELAQKNSGEEVVDLSPVQQPAADTALRTVPMNSPRGFSPLTANTSAPTVPQKPVVPPITPISPQPLAHVSTVSAAPKPIPAPTAVDDMLSKPQVSQTEKVNVGISPAKPSYKVDPYLEPPV